MSLTLNPNKTSCRLSSHSCNACPSSPPSAVYLYHPPLFYFYLISSSLPLSLFILLVSLILLTFIIFFSFYPFFILLFPFIFSILFVPFSILPFSPFSLSYLPLPPPFLSLLVVSVLRQFHRAGLGIGKFLDLYTREVLASNPSRNICYPD
jgi:hypothetical protein